MPLLKALLLMASAGLAPSEAPALPSDWANLPKLQHSEPPRYSHELTDFVLNEHQRGRCKIRPLANGWRFLQVDILVLVDPGGNVLKTVPAKVGCPTVERYSARTVERLIKGKVIGPGGPASAWYRTHMRYAWK